MQISEEIKVCTPEVHPVVILLFTLLSALRILNSTILWSLQLRLPLTFPFPIRLSFLVRMRSITAPPLIGSSITWRKNSRNLLIAYVLLCCCSSTYQGAGSSPEGTWVCCCVSAKGLICLLYLVRWPVENSYNNVVPLILICKLSVSSSSIPRNSSSPSSYSYVNPLFTKKTTDHPSWRVCILSLQHLSHRSHPVTSLWPQ